MQHTFKMQFHCVLIVFIISKTLWITINQYSYSYYISEFANLNKMII